MIGAEGASWRAVCCSSSYSGPGQAFVVVVRDRRRCRSSGALSSRSAGQTRRTRISRTAAVRSCDPAAEAITCGKPSGLRFLILSTDSGRMRPSLGWDGPAGPRSGGARLGCQADAAGRGARAAKGRSIIGIRKDLPRGPAGIVVDPCPRCDQADLEPHGGKHVCPHCGYTQPCCQA